MARPASQIILPTARLEQLRTLAASQATSIGGVIESFIRRSIADGELPDELPGYKVETSGAFVILAIPGHACLPLSADEARETADVIERGGRFRLPDATEMLSLRQGRGVAICMRGIEGQLFARSTMTPGMAVDLARIIRNAADRASAH